MMVRDFLHPPSTGRTLATGQNPTGRDGPISETVLPLAPALNPIVYSPPLVDRIWGIWGSYYNIPKAVIFYLLKGDYKPQT